MSNEGIFSIFSILRKSNVHSTTFHFECKWLADFNPSRAAKWMICISILIEKSPATHFPFLYVKLILITVIFKLPILLMIPIGNLKLGGVLLIFYWPFLDVFCGLTVVKSCTTSCNLIVYLSLKYSNFMLGNVLFNASFPNRLPASVFCFVDFLLIKTDSSSVTSW